MWRTLLRRRRRSRHRTQKPGKQSGQAPNSNTELLLRKFLSAPLWKEALIRVMLAHPWFPLWRSVSAVPSFPVAITPDSNFHLYAMGGGNAGHGVSLVPIFWGPAPQRHTEVCAAGLPHSAPRPAF